EELGFLDWRYFPLQERVLAYTQMARTDYRINLSTNYKILPGLNTSIQYQFGRGLSNTNNTSEAQSFEVRNLINSFTQINANSGSISRPIPIGNILRLNNGNYASQYGRAQINFAREWGEKHKISALTAFEVKD